MFSVSARRNLNVRQVSAQSAAIWARSRFLRNFYWNCVRKSSLKSVFAKFYDVTFTKRSFHWRKSMCKSIKFVFGKLIMRVHVIITQNNKNWNERFEFRQLINDFSPGGVFFAQPYWRGVCVPDVGKTKNYRCFSMVFKCGTGPWWIIVF